jgi:hypothetical protein
LRKLAVFQAELNFARYLLLPVPLFKETRFKPSLPHVSVAVPLDDLTAGLLNLFNETVLPYPFTAINFSKLSSVTVPPALMTAALELAPRTITGPLKEP